VSSGIHATVDRGAHAVTVRAEDNLMPFIETFLQEGALVVRVRPSVAIAPTRRIDVTITTETLAALSLSGGASGLASFGGAHDDFIATLSGGSELTLSKLDARVLTVDASGGSRALVSGTAESLTLTASGGSHLDTIGTPVSNARVDASGGSELRVRVSGQVTGALSGGSALYVFGGGSAAAVSASGGSTVAVGVDP